MILALDFDGVICDSVHECLQTSYVTLKEIDANRDYAELPSDHITQLFWQRRGVVRPSRNFYALWKWILELPDEQFDVLSFESFARSLESRLDSFEKRFLEVRNDCRKSTPNEFLKLNPLYPGVARNWGKLPVVPYIVSTKDVESIQMILEFNGLKVKGVFGKGSGSKPKTILNLSKKQKVSETYFIDDNDQNALEVELTGAKVALAEWGYGPKSNFSGLRIKDFSQILEFTQRH